MDTPIVIGAGPAGMRIARSLAQTGDVLVLDSDPDSPQSTEGRPQLLALLSENHTSEPPPISAHVPPRIRVLSGRKVLHIDRSTNQLVDNTGEVHAYSTLFLALGANPVMPELEGSSLEGVQFLYTRFQLEVLIQAMSAEGRLVVVGGGLLAVELAALAIKRTPVTLVARSGLLQRYLDRSIGQEVRSLLEKQGVQVVESATVKRLYGAGHVAGVELVDGVKVAARQVVLACGAAPNTGLAQKAGLAFDEGVLADAGMRSVSDTRIYVVGDCAQPPWSVVRGNITQVLYSADVALATAFGRPLPERIPDRYLECELGGQFRLIVAGLHLSASPSMQRRTRCSRARGALTVTLQQNRIVSFQALLSEVQAVRLLELWQSGAQLSWLILAALSRFMWLPPTRQQDPVVCRCANVRRSTIRLAASEYGGDVQRVCEETQAGVHCGGCLGEIAVLCGKTVPAYNMAVRGIVTAILLLTALIVLLPAWQLPDSVLAGDFDTFRLMISPAARQASGYCLSIVILMTLFVRNRRNGYWWHVGLGSFTLFLLPLHSLGGPTDSVGLNAGLAWLIPLVVLSGGLLQLRRYVKSFRFAHLAATLVLLAATMVHVFFVYQY